MQHETFQGHYNSDNHNQVILALRIAKFNTHLVFARLCSELHVLLQSLRQLCWTGTIIALIYRWGN